MIFRDIQLTCGSVPLSLTPPNVNEPIAFNYHFLWKQTDSDISLHKEALGPAILLWFSGLCLVF